MRAIVLNTTKYSDTGSVVHLYTEELGRMQYAVYGNKYKGILRPLNIIEFSANKRQNAPQQMSSIASAALNYTPTLLTTDVQRQCVAMFIAEVLLQSVKHPMSDKPLYDWLCQVIEQLDKETEVKDLHLAFMVEYASFLGIGVDETVHPEWLEAPKSRQERQQRLRELTNYYREHIEEFNTPKSLDVLIEVFD